MPEPPFVDLKKIGLLIVAAVLIFPFRQFIGPVKVPPDDDFDRKNA